MILRTDTSPFLGIMAIKHYLWTRLKFEKPISLFTLSKSLP